MKVSIIIPTYNEEKNIINCLKSLSNQTINKDEFEVLIVDGNSKDKTLDLAKKFSENSKLNIKFYNNTKKIAPIAFNIGIKKSIGDLIVIISGHIFLKRNFIEKNIEYHNKIDAECIGGPIETVNNDNIISKNISYALSFPFGVGNSKFRTSEKPQYVDTVAFGSYKKEVFHKIGLFKENLTRNQDLELNARLRKNGGKIYMTPEIKSYYINRNNLKGLWKQNFNNGFWNVETINDDRNNLSFRHFVPFLFVVSLILSLISMPFTTLFVKLILGSYFTVSVISSIYLAIKKKNILSILILPVVFLTLHLSYGAGTLIGIFHFFKNDHEVKINEE